MTLTAYRFWSAAASVMVLGLLSQASPGPFTVPLSGTMYSPDEVWQPDCTVTVQPGQSIQKAIDQAPEGAVICLAVGTWEENLEIKKGLTLRGLGQKPQEVWIVSAKEGYPVMRIESDSEIEVNIEKLTAAEAKGCVLMFTCVGVQVLGKGKARINETRFSSNDSGLVVGDSAIVNLINSSVSDNKWDGLVVGGLASVSLTSSTISDNKRAGLMVVDSAKVELRSSTIAGNGTHEDCKEKDWPWICNGIAVGGKSQTTITDSKIINNADWGVAAGLKKCGYGDDYFTGKVTIDEKTVIEGNNKSGNQDGMGNPGHHRWNQAGVPDGQVCLP